MLCYSIKQFESFHPNPLSKDILDIIDTLSNSLVVSTGGDFKERVATNIQDKKNHTGHRTHHHHHNHNHNHSGGKSQHHNQPQHNKYAPPSRSESERLYTPFKITALEQKEGIEKTFNDIQILLNKLSNKNYRENVAQILDHIQKNNLYDNDESIRKIAHFIFTVVSQNAFFTELYSNLFIEFESQFSIFQTILLEKVDEYIASFRDFKYVESSDNYEDYCAFNKSNDARKATAAFFVHLMNKRALANDPILRIIEVLQDIIIAKMETEQTAGYIDEIFEFLAIFMANTKITLYDNTPHLLENIETISKIAPKERKSVSSRTIFKAIDLYDKICKSV
jgi:hypothetical protein